MRYFLITLFIVLAFANIPLAYGFNAKSEQNISKEQYKIQRDKVFAELLNFYGDNQKKIDISVNKCIKDKDYTQMDNQIEQSILNYWKWQKKIYNACNAGSELYYRQIKDLSSAERLNLRKKMLEDRTLCPQELLNLSNYSHISQ